MKVFWSWQSDTPGKIGRHFVREALSEAIDVLRQPNEIEEPSERDARENLHLDHDRKGVPGSPDLAPTIFRKIEKALVFIADITIVQETAVSTSKGEGGRPRKFINPNVAIEYGYALGKLGDGAILMVQNRYFGARDDLPFDLKHKAGPIQYSLAPDATKQQIETERGRLRGEFVIALRPYLNRAASSPAGALPEIPMTSRPAFYFNPSEVLARIDPGGANEIEYRFNEPYAFYLRLIPTKPRTPSLKIAELLDVVGRRRLDVLTRTLNAGFPDRNRFGAIAYEPHGTSTTPLSFSQTFPNGEIWGVTSNLSLHRGDGLIVPTTNVENLYRRALENYCSVASHEFGIEPPYNVELGAIGLSDARLGIGRDTVSGPIYQEECKLRRVLNDTSPGAIQRVVEEFLVELFDLAGEVR
jgi:hypothetical protein